MGVLSDLVARWKADYAGAYGGYADGLAQCVAELEDVINLYGDIERDHEAEARMSELRSRIAKKSVDNH